MTTNASIFETYPQTFEAGKIHCHLHVVGTMVEDCQEEKEVNAEGVGSTVEIARAIAYEQLSRRLLYLWQRRPIKGMPQT